jgi:hypothetical protein
VLDSEEHVQFMLGEYDATHPLVIDPILSHRRASGETRRGSRLDAAGNIYAVGTTWSSGLPRLPWYQTQLAGNAGRVRPHARPRPGPASFYATYLVRVVSPRRDSAIAVDAQGASMSRDDGKGLSDHTGRLPRLRRHLRHEAQSCG